MLAYIDAEHHSGHIKLSLVSTPVVVGGTRRIGVSYKGREGSPQSQIVQQLI